jgi:hypothetical protein
MISRQIPWLVSVFILLLGGCVDNGNQPVGSLIPGGLPVSYDYRAYNASGTLAVKGILTLTALDSTSVTGIWSTFAVLPGEKVGPQVGTGKAAGTLENSSISLNLNPGWADNNVLLLGTVGPDRITGRWSWITFVGPTSQGTFEAIKGGQKTSY